MSLNSTSSSSPLNILSLALYVHNMLVMIVWKPLFHFGAIKRAKKRKKLFEQHQEGEGDIVERSSMKRRKNKLFAS